MSNKKSYTFHVKEMHCKSCTILTESELIEHPEVESICAELSTKTINVTGDFGEKTSEIIASELSELMQKHGYTIATESVAHKPARDFRRALPIAAVVMVGFLLLQKSGIIAGIGGGGEITITTALLIGFVASLSSCGAVVGGLALSLTTHYASKGERIMPQLFFHAGRILSFFILGGILGAIGTMFSFGFYGTLALNLIVATMMLLLGINILGLARVKTFTLPSFISSPIKLLTTSKTPLAPFLLGAITFFLPCGFTQSAQLYTLSLGSFVGGAKFMGVFALGTLPVLAIISFLPLAFRNPEKKALFNTLAGILVIFFALYTLINTLNAYLP